MTSRTAQSWHGLTAIAALASVLAQVVLTVLGLPAPEEPPGPRLGERLFHLFSYFTILSNLLVLGTSASAALDPEVDGPRWRVLRMNAVVGITVTGLVHWFLLRPLSELTGLPFVVDLGLHVVVPVLALVGWILFGPRPRTTFSTVLLGMVYPLAWLAYTLVVGAVSGWYPYPFLDVAALGAVPVAVTCLLLTVLVFGFCAAMWWGDRRLRSAPVTAHARGREPARSRS